jgi:hypothetical protein
LLRCAAGYRIQQVPYWQPVASDALGVQDGRLPADKKGGIADLQKTAQQGHYLAPLARILLAIAYVREKDKSRALQILNALRADFPSNRLVTREIAQLQAAQ